MQWTTYRDPFGYLIELPNDWVAEVLPGPAEVFRSPDRRAFVLLQPLRDIKAGGAAIIQRGLFPAATLFPGAKIEHVQPGPNGAGFGTLTFQLPDGTIARARMAVVPSGEMGMLNAVAAAADRFGEIEATMMRILQSPRLAAPPTPGATATGAASPIPASPTTPAPAAPATAGASTGQQHFGVVPPLGPIIYTPFTEPQMGTVTLEVPQGWPVRGGLAHPMPGDRRCWVETRSPDGIQIINGDPAFPQSFCHFKGYPEGQFAQMAAGGQMMNLTPGAQRVADLYLKTIASRRLGTFQIGARRPRPDVVSVVNENILKMGIKMPRSSQIMAVETMLQLTGPGEPRLASLLVTSVFNGQYTLGMWAFWDANVFTWIAPPSLAARADEVRFHMIATARYTPRMFELVQRDEAIISANGQAANAAQWNWFNAQQATHRAQVAAGDAMVDNYWKQQAANDAMARNWEHNQGVYDQISQSHSDAMMDRQRLADDADGKEYHVAAGSNYYWRNPQTGEVVGTETATPPDYQNNYTQLRKL
jgi:hypothetical protein